MKLSDLNPFVPAQPDRTRAFMESVQPSAPPVHEQLGDTGKSIVSATRKTIASLVSLPAALVESILYGFGTVSAVPSIVFNKAASISSAVRAKIFHVVGGKGYQPAASDTH